MMKRARYFAVASYCALKVRLVRLNTGCYERISATQLGGLACLLPHRCRGEYDS